MKIYEPQKQRDHESVQVQIPLLFTFMDNNDFMQVVIHATIHGNKTV